MRGMGKGLIGAVVKPTAGVLDLATDISTGIKHSAYGTPLTASTTNRADVPDAVARQVTCGR
jgi:hypothetical protein